MKFLTRAVSKMHPLEILFRALLIGVGGLLYLFAGWFAAGSVWTISTHDFATADVTRSFAEGSPGARFQTYRIEAKFSTERGDHRTEISRAMTKPEPGDRIPIYYQMETAYESRLGGFWGLWFLPLLIGLFGSVFMFFALKP
jgi:hypothetical protein